MPEFLKLIPPAQALQIFLSHLKSRVNAETLPTTEALGRVTVSPIFSPIPLPSFPRSTVDGYAVRAEDTFGSSESLPGYLRVKGEILMGAIPSLDLVRGEAVLIHTGGMLPDSSDAVVMLENTQRIGTDTVEISHAVSVGENVLKVGEDVEQGQEVIATGVRLRPAEIGGLAALGILNVEVARKPVIGILSSGDEVLSPDAELKPGHVRDINSYTLSALVEQVGGISRRYGIFADRFEILQSVSAKALEECDSVVITAGSSASARDLTARVITGLGEPGVLVHGVNIKPGKPTILAVCKNKAVIGLPGNPVSALVIAGFYVVPVVELLLGLSSTPIRPIVRAKLNTNVPSQAGREDWVPTRLELMPEGYQAEPIFSKSNLIFSLVRANGMIRVPSEVTGLSAGELVEVYLFT
jgi:molybdopterin molybdotransferase